MRYFILALSIALIFNSCKNDVIVYPKNNQILSASAVLDSMQYTFAIPRAVFGIHDTLSASFTAYNQSAEPETLMISIESFRWSLKNDSGRTLMGGPPLLSIPRSQPLILNPHQSKEIFGLYQAITDASGAPVIAGSYTLQGLFDSMSFTLDLSLQ
jgi:hypothetical protein